MLELKEKQDALLAHHTALAAGGPSWLRDIRDAAAARFLELGLPTTKHEEWKYTNVSPIAKTVFEPAGSEPSPLTADQAASVQFEKLQAPRLVFVNGHFAPELSNLYVVQGLHVSRFLTGAERGAKLAEHNLTRHAVWQEHPFTALNTASFADAVLVEVDRDAVPEQPVYIVYLSVSSGGRPTASHPRVLVVAGANSKAAVVEEYQGLGTGAYLTNCVTEIVAGENAVVEHYKLQRESVNAFHVSTVQLYQERNSTVTTHSVQTGAALARNDVNAVLDGENAEATLNGLFLTAGSQLNDNHTVLDHARPHCRSREFYKGVLDGASTGVFNGRIIVRQDAQKTDAIQSNKNLLLSEHAVINTKPQLEIYADDVRCTHGATVGQLDKEALFYLQSRGVGAADARNMLTHAFAVDVLERMTIGPIRERLDQVLLHRFAGAAEPSKER
jgi:Fe-S cluster assembly protein SufD